MKLFSPVDQPLIKAMNAISYGNPFLPARFEDERRVLGDAFVDSDTAWNLSGLAMAHRPNLAGLTNVVERLCRDAREKLVSGVRPNASDALLYEGAVMYLLYDRRNLKLERMILDALAGQPLEGLAEMFKSLTEEVNHFLELDALAGLLPPHDPAHLLACFFQIRRAFVHIFSTIVGKSAPAARLRASIWQSIFTHDMRRYRRTLFDQTGDFTTLVVGPSGTGKELVARAIGLSRYIPFDAKKKSFAEDFAGSFHALNLSALSPTLVESELFGHRRGAFTGAIEDRQGWLQVCPPLGTVFLDEIGELDPMIQVKLLRVLQTRRFQRLGDTRTLAFRGKIIAATNRDLAQQMSTGGFRKDFYYRLCSDIITTPSLRDQIADSPEELRTLVTFISHRLLPDDAEKLADEVMENIDRHLGPTYAWPGNFRELEQCVRNVLIRGEYRPAVHLPSKPRERFARDLEAGALTANELLAHYCAHVYTIAGSYDAASKILKLDRRTVAAKIAEHDARRRE